jgi:hypothetical protein
LLSLACSVGSQAARSGELPPKSRVGRPRSLCFMNEYLVWNVYVRAGWTYEQISPLFPILPSFTSDIIHTWSVFWMIQMMPCPTLNQLLADMAVYPAHVIPSLGHARSLLNVHCTELSASPLPQPENLLWVETQSAS